MKRIKSLIFKTSFILMLCIFTLISFKDNKAKAANYPTISIETSKSSVTPGGTFDLTISIDSANTGGASWAAISYFLYITNPDILEVGNISYQEEFTTAKYTDASSIKRTNVNINMSEADDAEEINKDVYEISFQLSEYNTLVKTSEVSVVKAVVPITVKENVDSNTIDFVQDILNVATAVVFYDDNGAELEFVGGFSDERTINFAGDKTVTVSAPSPNTALNTVDITSTNGENFNYTSSNLTGLIDKTITVLAETNKLSLNATALFNGNIKNVTVNGNAATLNGDSYDINLLDAGSTNNIIITVESENKNNTQEFSFKVARQKYSISTLDSLDFKLPSGVLGNINLQKGEGNNYTLNLPDGEDNILVKSVVTPNVMIDGAYFNNVKLTNNDYSEININGLSAITIVVKAQDETTTSYTVNINRLSNDNSISNLKAYLKNSTGETPLELENHGNNYSANVVYTNNLGFRIDCTTNAEIAFNPASKSVSFDNTYLLNKKTITITVTSESGRVATYTVTVTREAASTDANITYEILGNVSGNEYQKSSSSTETKWIYELPLSEEKAKVKISGVSSTTTISGTANATTLEFLANGYYELVITPENPSYKKTIEVWILKAKDTNNKVSNIVIQKGEADSESVDGIDYTFSEIATDQTYEYSVSYNVSTIYINATFPESATCYGAGTKTLRVGLNTFEVYAKSEAGVTGAKYVFKITREAANTDNKLSSLKINDVEYIASGELTTKKICLDRNVGNINVVATLNNSLAKINSESTLGNISIASGASTTIRVLVTSESGSTKTYEIVVCAMENDNTITNINIVGKLSDGSEYEVSYEFGKNITFSVPYKVVSLNVEAVTNANHATVSGAGEISLTAGSSKTISVYLTSEYGIKGETYTIKATREAANTDNKLSSLKINDVEYIASGELTTKKICLDRNVGNINVVATLNNSLAKINSESTLGNISIASGASTTIRVLVTSESGSTKTYEIVVCAMENDNTITNINIVGKLSDGSEYEVSYEFGKNITFSVPYKVVSLNVEAVTNANHATVSGAGEISLTAGSSKTISVYLTSEYGIKGETYTIKATREAANTDNNLTSLSFMVNGVEYVSALTNPVRILIPLSVNLNVYKTAIISATLSNELSSISGLGEVTLPLRGQSIIYSVIVTSEAGNKNEYKLIVTSEAENTPELDTNNDMASIGLIGGSDNTNFLDGVSLDDIKNAGTAGYQITIPWNVSLLTASAITISAKASICYLADGSESNGVYHLNEMGTSQMICIYAVSESQAEGTHYYIKVTRLKASSDAYLTGLTINDNVINVEPNKYIIPYRVDHNVDIANIVASISTKATISGVGSKTLSIGINKFVLTVVAEDGTTKNDYELYIYRAENVSDILDITIDNVDYTFNPDENNITLEVPYTMTSINVNAKTSALYATKRGTGIYNLTTDYLEFDVYIEGEYHLYSNDGNISQKYHFKVKRALRDTDVSLSELIVEVKGEPVQFDKEFKPDILSYNVVITDDDVYSVFIKATANSKNSTVSNVGNIELATLTITSPNTYVIDVKVIAEAVRGDLEISQTYKLFVSREKVNLDNRNDILSITIQGENGRLYFANEFNPTKNNYEINVEYSVKNIYVQATGNGASIVGAGVYQLTEDAKTEIVVYAISESGNIGKKYTFNVYRAKADTDSSLKSLMIDGALITGFRSDKYNYEKDVIYQVQTIDIVAIANKETSIVQIMINNVVHSGLKIELEPDSQTIVSIMVIAENGAISTYVITVNRASADGRLTNLYIEGVNFQDENGETIVFNDYTFTYYAVLAYSYESINIIGLASDPSIEIRGIGEFNLTVGRQEFQVAAIPKTGKITVYSIIVIRKAEATSNTNVSSFEVNEIPGFKTDFSNGTDIYEQVYEVESSINKLTYKILFDITEYEDSPTCKVFGNDLRFGFNTVLFIITSTDLSQTRTIVINVLRKNVKIDEISIKQIGDFEADYSDEVNNYSYTVSSRVKKLDINVSLANPDETYEISNTSLKNGNNNIVITIKSNGEISKEIYLNVYRSNDASAIDYAIMVGSVVILTAAYFVFRSKKRKI